MRHNKGNNFKESRSTATYLSRFLSDGTPADNAGGDYSYPEKFIKSFFTYL
jgi:hypothetical protein